VTKYSLIVIWVEDPVDDMADEQFELQLTSNVNIFSDIFMSFGKNMSDHQSVRLLKLIELFGLGVEVLLRVKLGNDNLA